MGITSIDELKRHSIAVASPIRARYPQFNEDYTINPNPLPELENGYYVNNGVVAFQTGNVKYITPHTREVMHTLLSNGFRSVCMFVPFSNWDYPVDYQGRWVMLQNEAAEQQRKEFTDDCLSFSEKHGFKELSNDTLRRCFEMPSTGVPVKHPYFEDVYYPLITSTCLDCIAIERIGRYCTNNGITVFVYRDGKTYVSRDYSVVVALRDNGYIEDRLFVPFSNGEVITNPMYAKMWKETL